MEKIYEGEVFNLFPFWEFEELIDAFLLEENAEDTSDEIRYIDLGQDRHYKVTGTPYLLLRLGHSLNVVPFVFRESDTYEGYPVAGVKPIFKKERVRAKGRGAYGNETYPGGRIIWKGDILKYHGLFSSHGYVLQNEYDDHKFRFEMNLFGEDWFTVDGNSIRCIRACDKYDILEVSRVPVEKILREPVSITEEELDELVNKYDKPNTDFPDAFLRFDKDPNYSYSEE